MENNKVLLYLAIICNTLWDEVDTLHNEIVQFDDGKNGTLHRAGK